MYLFRSHEQRQSLRSFQQQRYVYLFYYTYFIADMFDEKSMNVLDSRCLSLVVRSIKTTRNQLSRQL